MQSGQGLLAGFRVRGWGSAGELHTRESTSVFTLSRGKSAACGQPRINRKMWSAGSYYDGEHAGAYVGADHGAYLAEDYFVCLR